LDSQFVAEMPKFVAGCLSALSAMVQLELPHVNVLTKVDQCRDKVGDMPAVGVMLVLLAPLPAQLRDLQGTFLCAAGGAGGFPLPRRSRHAA
jgi:hypothetical protein